MKLDAEFWKQRWESGETGWDVGYATPAITRYVDRIGDKGIKILSPGAGNGYEAEYLWKAGFKHVDVVDFSAMALGHLQGRVPDFPASQLIVSDFFALEGVYDLVIEQTFFCALEPRLRPAYVRQMHKLLRPGGVLAGLLFDFAFDTEKGPPFGGSREEYEGLFGGLFEIRKMEVSTDSIKPREGRELWVELVRKVD